MKKQKFDDEFLKMKQESKINPEAKMFSVKSAKIIVKKFSNFFLNTRTELNQYN